MPFRQRPRPRTSEAGLDSANMAHSGRVAVGEVDRTILAGIAAVSAALLMTELALTRIFSVTMYYHFAFLAISIALFGLSASGVLVYVLRRRLAAIGTRDLLAGRCAPPRAWRRSPPSPASSASASASTTRRDNLALMLAIYGLAALPFFTGGAVISRRVRAADGTHQRAVRRGPARRRRRLPGADSRCSTSSARPACVLIAAALSMAAAVGVRARPPGGGASSRSAWRSWPRQPRLSSPARPVRRRRHQRARGRSRALQQVELVLAGRGLRPRAWRLVAQPDVHRLARRLAVHGHRFGGVDADRQRARVVRRMPRTCATSSPRWPIALAERPAGFTALVIGPGGGRDLLSALVFGATRVDGVEINPIIARDVMLQPVPRLLGQHLHRPARRDPRRRRPQLRPAERRIATT